MMGLIYMANVVPPHNHCLMCMKSIPVSETLCSEDCKQKYQKMMKRKRLTILFMWVMIVVFLGVLFFSQAIY